MGLAVSWYPGSCITNRQGLPVSEATSSAIDRAFPVVGSRSGHCGFNGEYWDNAD
jgi:hypothetical protein